MNATRIILYGNFILNSNLFEWWQPLLRNHAINEFVDTLLLRLTVDAALLARAYILHEAF